MEAFKHSCPFCGQHIEYTVGYCGRQMQCPTCSKTVTFPAIPPNRNQLKTRSLEAKREKKQMLPGAVSWVRDFEHWNVVWQCTVPFLIIAGLLAGAIFVKNKFSNTSSSDASAPTVQADPSSWKKMADLAKAEQNLQAAAATLNQAQSVLTFETQSRARLGSAADPMQRKGADERVQNAQARVNMVRRQFDAAESKYRELGGNVDYRSKVRGY